MNGLPYVGPDGRVVILPPGQMPPPGYRATGPLGQAFQGPQGSPQGPMQPGPVGNPQGPAMGPQGAPTAAPGAPEADNDTSASWFAGAAAAAQNINNPMAALAAGLSTLTSSLNERDQARRLIKRQEAMDKLQARRVDIEQQQVDAQAKRWDAEGPEREARAKLLTSQAAEVAQRMNQPQFLNLGDGYTRQVNPDGTTMVLDAPADMKALAQGKLNAERARVALAEGPKWYKGDLLYGKDGKSYQSWNNGRTGETEYQDTETAQRLTAIPGGVLRPQDTGVGKMADLAAKSQEEAYRAGPEARGQLALYDRAEAILDSSGVGAGWAQQAARAAAEALGVNVGNVNLADKQEMEAMLARMETQVAEVFRGQGQITEGERAILRNAIPQMRLDPAAFRQVLQVYRNVAMRKLGALEAWDGMTREDQAKVSGGFTQFQYRWMRDTVKRENDAASAQAQAPKGVSPGSYKTDDGFSYTVE